LADLQEEVQDAEYCVGLEDSINKIAAISATYAPEFTASALSAAGAGNAADVHVLASAVAETFRVIAKRWAELPGCVNAIAGIGLSMQAAANVWMTVYGVFGNVGIESVRATAIEWADVFNVAGVAWKDLASRESNCQKVPRWAAVMSQVTTAAANSHIAWLKFFDKLDCDASKELVAEAWTKAWMNLIDEGKEASQIWSGLCGASSVNQAHVEAAARSVTELMSTMSSNYLRQSQQWAKAVAKNVPLAEKISVIVSSDYYITEIAEVAFSWAAAVARFPKLQTSVSMHWMRASEKLLNDAQELTLSWVGPFRQTGVESMGWLDHAGNAARGWAMFSQMMITAIPLIGESWAKQVESAQDWSQLVGKKLFAVVEQISTSWSQTMRAAKSEEAANNMIALSNAWSQVFNMAASNAKNVAKASEHWRNNCKVSAKWAGAYSAMVKSVQVGTQGWVDCLGRSEEIVSSAIRRDSIADPSLPQSLSSAREAIIRARVAVGSGALDMGLELVCDASLSKWTEVTDDVRKSLMSDDAVSEFEDALHSVRNSRVLPSNAASAQIQLMEHYAQQEQRE